MGLWGMGGNPEVARILVYIVSVRIFLNLGVEKLFLLD